MSSVDPKLKIISNSPVEFVLVGPHHGRDRVLLSTNTAGIDLKGLAVEGESEWNSDRSGVFLFPIFSEKPRQLNVVESVGISDLDSEYDSRKSIYRFAWVGLCSKVGREKIQDLFARTIPEIRADILKGEREDIELTISPLILNCTLANERRLKSQRNFRVLLIVYGILTLTVLLVMAIGFLLDRWSRFN